MPRIKPNKKPTQHHQKAKLLSPIFLWWRHLGLWKRFLSAFIALVFIWVCIMYTIAQWYIYSHKDQGQQLGVTFIPRYARYYELDPKETMQAIIDDLGVKHFRLVSYWDEIERSPGYYDFSELDWQFDKANKAGATVSLSIGLRQPRWPECHHPAWTKNRPIHEWYQDLKDFMQKIIERYGNHPNLVSYQLENEFFMTVFGICPDHSRHRLVDEYKFVKKLDKDTPIIISRSNNWVGLPLNEPRPDQFGISVYKRVWDKSVTKRYFEYPLPAWFYAFLAGSGELFTGKTMIVHELQAEAWLPDGFDMRTAPVSEMYKSMNPSRLRDRFQYGRATGMNSVDLWGVEWWYYMKQKRQAPELWNVAREEFHKNQVKPIQK